MKKIRYILGIIGLACMLNLTGCIKKEDTGGDKKEPEEIVIIEDVVTGPHFSETVDLMTLIARMAGTAGFTECYVSSISKSADSYFEPYANHQAVQLMKSYKSSGISYDAVTAYGNLLCLTDKGNLVFNPKYQEHSSRSFDRWSEKQKKDMLEAVNDFYKTSNFHRWFESVKSLQDNAIRNFTSVCNLDYKWFDSFYGKNDKIASRIILCFFMGGNSQGISYTKNDGTFFLTPTMGAFGEENGNIYFFGGINTIVHEFSHPYCNPLVDKNWSFISFTADYIFSHVRSEMIAQSYSESKSMICENMVRSCAIMYMMSHGEQEYAEDRILQEKNNSFLLVPDLVEALKEREAQASKYPTLESYMPVIVDLINNFSIE